MVTYKHVTEVVRNSCDNHQAKRVDSRAIVLLIAISVGESEMVTSKHVNEVVRNGCVKHQAKRVDSRAILS